MTRAMRAISWLVVCALGCGGAGTATQQGGSQGGPPPPAPGPSEGRLPRDVVPLAYELALTIVPDQPTFTGRGQIRVRLEQPRDVIFLNAKGLTVGEAQVVADGETLAAQLEQVDDDGLARLSLPRAIGPGEATLRFAWEAPFRDDLGGLFKVEAGGAAYAFTQMEPLDARTAFPSFDEPAFKTPFDVSLTVKSEHRAIANTADAEEVPAGDGMKTIRFSTSRPMPTYLLAWAVGPLDVVPAPAIPPNDVRTRALPFRGVAVAGRGAELAYALESTPAILAILEEYFGSPYPYDKLDIIAIPGFNGAMENVGAVTFADTILLVDAENASAQQKRWFGYTMAHELAHMWFGNLVTMEWWDDLWLNEAMASWMETKATGRWQPEWHADREQTEWVLGAMDADSLASARYIRQPIRSTHDIHNAFDWITYTKGLGVLAMFEHWLGEEKFRAGIRSYLAARPFGTATAADLASALSQAAERDVTPALQSFLLQSGIPLIEVALDCPEGTPPAVTLSQSRYLPAGSDADARREWHVPVCVAYGAGGERRETCTLLEDASGGLALEADACPEWILPNADAAGYYRWTLAPELLGQLRAEGLDELSVPERMSVADSLGAAYDAARAPAADVLAALEPLARDDARQVATMPMAVIDHVGEYAVASDQRARFERWARGLYQPRLARLGWQARPRETEEDGLFRAEVIGFLALVVEDPAVRRQAAQRARRYLGIGGDGQIHSEAVPAELVRTVLVVAAQDGDGALFDAMSERLAASEDGILRGHLLVALGSFRDPELAVRARELTLLAELRPNERLRPLRAQFADPRTRDEAWRFLTERFDAIAERAGASIWTANLPELAEPFCSSERAAEVQRFFEPRVEQLSGGPRNLAAAVETIRLCAARVDAQRESVASFFGR